MTLISPRLRDRRAWLPLAAAMVLVVATYVSRLDQSVGLMVDDAWYVLLAKSLADGTGYGLVNAPTPIGLTPYPPGFPGLLLPVFWINPAFPQNLLLLKALSTAAMCGVTLVTYRYAERRGLSKGLALSVAVATALTPGLVFLATSTVMSECVYTLTQILAIVFVDRTARTDARLRDGAIAVALTAAGMLIRTAGAMLLVAAVLYLFSHRLWRRGLLFAAAVAICLSPWLWYERTHEATLEQRLEHGGGHAFTYGQNFWMRVAGHPSTGTASLADLPARVRDNVVDVFGRDMVGIVMPSLLRGPDESGEEVVGLGGGLMMASMGSARQTLAISVLLSGVVVLGFAIALRRGATCAEYFVPLALGMILIWPFWSFRFVLPLTPLLLFYGALALHRIAPPALVRVSLLTIVGLHVLDHTQYVYARQTQMVEWAVDTAEAEDVIEWMSRNLPAEGHVATTNPPLIHLRTGRKTVALDDLSYNLPRWKRGGVRYLVSLRRRPLPLLTVPHKVLYRSPSYGLWVIEI